MTPKQWQPPKYWQDFEEMLQQLYAAEVKPDYIARYGRAGQEQHGVDIVARADSTWTAIQCKLKTDLLGGRLTKKEITNAYKSSRKFEPGLVKLWVATTLARDNAMQGFAAALSRRAKQKYPVEILFWDDVERYLEHNPRVASVFYPDAFAPERALNETADGDFTVALQPTDWEQRLELVFQHGSFTAVAGVQLPQLRVILAELVDNALSPAKGGASRVVVSLAGCTLLIRDDGKTFDSLSEGVELEPGMRGIRSIRESLRAAGAELVHSYTASNPAMTRFNVNQIDIHATRAAPRDRCGASGPATYLLTRAAASEFVRSLVIPDDCETYTLRLVGTCFVAPSAGSELITLLIGRLRGRKLHIKISYECVGLIDTLEQDARSHPGVTIEQI